MMKRQFILGVMMTAGRFGHVGPESHEPACRGKGY